MTWRPGDYVALMERQIESVECSPALEERARAFFPRNRIRVIDGAVADFWAIVTKTNPFICTCDSPGDNDACEMHGATP